MKPWIATIIIGGALCAMAGSARAACETPSNPKSPVFVGGTNLATGYLTRLPVAELGPVQVFFSECAPATGTFATTGVYSNVDSLVRLENDGSLTLVNADGSLRYYAYGAQFRKIPDDGTFFVSEGTQYVLRSRTSPDEMFYRPSGSQLLIAETKRVVGATATPFTFSYFYDRDVNGALVGIRQSNSGDRIAIDRGTDFVRVQYFLTGRTIAADWFILRRAGSRLAAVDVPGPNGTARVGYTLSASGRMLDVVHPSGAITKYGHRTDGRINGTTVYEGQGAAPAVHARQTISYTLGAAGLTATVRASGDGANEAVRYAFTQDGLLRTINAGGIDTVVVTYDGSSRITRVEYPDRNASLDYAYNGASETIVQLTRGDGVSIYSVAALDPSGYLPVQYTENGVPTSITYDAFSRPTRIVSHDGATVRASFTATTPSLVNACTLNEATGEQACKVIDFANAGRIVSESTGHAGFGSADRVVQHEYDANHQVTRTTLRVGATLAAEVTYAGYDHRGLPASSRIIDQVMGGVPRTASYRYHVNGSLASVTDEEGFTRRYTYDAVGQIRQMTIERPNRTKSAISLAAEAGEGPLVTVDVGSRPACGSPSSMAVNGTATTTHTAEDTRPPPTNCEGSGSNALEPICKEIEFETQ